LTGEAPQIDGVLTDAAWSQAQPVTDFVQRQPNPGQPASLQTEVRVLFDAAAIYVGVRLHDPRPDSIFQPLGRRDLSGIASDWVHLFIDSYNDKRTAFRFSVNPRGVQKDVFHSNDFNEDLGWDAVWSSAAKVDSAGWAVEYRIPLSQLRFTTSTEGQGVWGFQVRRELARRSELSDFDPVLPDVNGFISQSGELHGLTGLRPVRRLEVLPYTVGRVTRAPGQDEDPFYDQNETFGSMGADVKYGITSDLTLTATINPDFGQVEADPSQVNLSAFETFFAERRPFFVEGADIFRFPVAFPYFVRSTGFGNDQPFYSRRLGRTPQGGAPNGVGFTDAPEATTILAAAKVSGKTRTGWSIGFLDALTAEENVRFMDDGDETEAVVEPLTNYLVARAIKDFRGGNSAVGVIGTYTHRELPDDGRLDFLTRDAFLAGVNGRHRFWGNNYEATASVLGTNVRGDEAAISNIQTRAGHFFQRPDADHVEFDPTRTSLSGWLADVQVEKLGGGRWRGGLYGHARSPGLEMNDVGFQRNTDWMLQGSWLGYHVNTPTKLFRNWNINANQWNGFTFGGERLTTGFNFNGSFQLHNNWGAYWSTDNEIEALRADVLRGGPAFVGPTYTNWNAGFFTDGRKKVSGEMWGGFFKEFGTVGGGWWTGAFLAFRPGGRIQASINPNLNVSQDPWIYVTQLDALGERRFVFAHIEQRSFSVSTRLSYAFTPKLTLEFYAQPFVAGGEYSEFREVADPRADDFDDRFHIYTPDEITFNADSMRYEVDLNGDGPFEFSFGKPDFNVKELRSNMVLRWEYRPGSALFLVWGSARSDFNPDGSVRFGRDFRRLFGRERGYDVPSTNVLLIKVNYWLNL
ncbi:MAG TPA: DUF5916 domain-containing protein, partial [Longimicrobiaceae bacterium]|nr:DUF5916 domain-containing protein [Longimicrobiaceae bacterium]